MVPNFEWLNEALVIRHTPTGSFPTFSIRPASTPRSRKRWGSYRPYFRYQYINASDFEPIFPDVRLRAGPSVGLRYDASESVALKLQYDYTDVAASAGHERVRPSARVHVLTRALNAARRRCS